MNVNFSKPDYLRTDISRSSEQRAGRLIRWRRAHPRLFLAAVAAALLLAVFILWRVISASFAHHDRTPPAPPVKVALARQADVHVLEHTIGTVVSPETVQVTAQVSGKLLTAEFTEGQMVHKGDLLFRIDPGPFRNALAEARAQLAKDTAQAQSLGNDQARYLALFAQNAASPQQRDQAVAAAKGAQASVQSDAAAVNVAEENLGYTEIRSPTDGKTGPIMIQPGNLVAANGASPLVVITQVQPVKVSFMVPQSDLTQVQNQMAAGKLDATIAMPGAPNGGEKAAVDFVSNIVAAATGTIELRATFPNSDLRMVPGQTVNVGVTIRDIPNATLVPHDAVNLGPDSSFVYVVGPKSVALAKTVQVLNDDGVNAAVAGDVKPGDKVITEGQLRVVAGQPVRSNGQGRSNAGASPSRRKAS